MSVGSVGSVGGPWGWCGGRWVYPLTKRGRMMADGLTCYVTIKLEIAFIGARRAPVES